ncbi:asparagine synthase (glutamine-hydrolyzing) [Patescibacteria group bacterium]|nr:asparagine synthase (glutamine-hydrolyzing) [Patescibacteria group bacterium]
MCGILGYVSQEEIDQDLFKSSLAALSKRGPDAEGIFQTYVAGKNIVLGHKRLAIIDLNKAANQPMISEDGNFVIVANNEIYNHLILKKDLLAKGYQFKTNSDTEVLLKGFIEYRQNIVEKIEGMFAFVILDKRKEKLTFVRDHFGKKPLFYCLTPNTLAFASETKALLKFPGIKSNLNINQLSLTKYLLYGYIPSPNSIFTEIKKVEPGTIFEFSLADWRIENQKEYWQLGKIEINSQIKEAEASEKLDFLLNEAVKKRLLADVPLGVFLSGGIDSSLVAALAVKYFKNINAFTVIYENYKNKELSFAEKTGQHLNIKVNSCCFKEKDVERNIKEILDYLDEPVADPAIVPLYYLAKQTKSQITVALSGDGGDEVFGGYPKYQAQILAEKLKYFKTLAVLMKSFSPRNSLARKILTGINLPFYARQFFYGSGGFSPDEIKNLLNLKSLDIDQIFSEAKYYNSFFQQNDPLNRSLYLDCKLQLPDWYLAKNDYASAAAAIEIRSPLLDKSLIEFSLSLRKEFKLKNFESKYLLKKTAEKYLPREIIYRKKKGFQLPLQRWLNSHLTDLDDLLGLGIFDEKAVLALKKGLSRRAFGSDTKMWRLIVLNSFIKNYL